MENCFEIIDTNQDIINIYGYDNIIKLITNKEIFINSDYFYSYWDFCNIKCINKNTNEQINLLHTHKDHFYYINETLYNSFKLLSSQDTFTYDYIYSLPFNIENILYKINYEDIKIIIGKLKDNNYFLHKIYIYDTIDENVESLYISFDKNNMMINGLTNYEKSLLGVRIQTHLNDVD